jgi:hypothetical protein
MKLRAAWVRLSTRLAGAHEGSLRSPRTIIARRIVEAAKSGERDPIRLCIMALAGLGISEEAS